MNEIKLQKDAARAVRAKQLLENELLTDAFTGLEAAYIERWRTTHIDDDAGRERLFIAVNVIGKVKEHLEHAISNGNVAAVELSNLAQEAERKTHFAR